MQIRLSVSSARDASAADRGADRGAAASLARTGTAALFQSGTGQRSAARQCVDVTVAAAAGTPFAAAVGALRGLAAVSVEGGVDGRFYCGAEPVPDDQPLGMPPLLDGAALTIGGPGAPGLPAGGLEVHVVGGPDAGGVHLLTPPPPGAEPLHIPIGRGADALIRIEDPDLSRLHADLVVSADWVQLCDRGSTNGTTLDGTAVGKEPVLLLPEMLVRLGESTLALRVAPQALPITPDRLGCLRVRTERTPAVRVPAQRIDMPPRPPARGLGAARRRAAVAFERAKTDAEGKVIAALANEAQLRRSKNPDLASLLAAAVRPEPGLWSRDARNPGLLELRLGTARVASLVTVGAGDQTFRPRVPGAPITIDLAKAGVLGLVGPRPALERLARALVAQLAALCAPTDLELVILCAGNAEPWRWVRWLPHLVPQDGQDCRALIGLDRAQVAGRLAELTARIAEREGAMPTRADTWTGRRTVVVVDGAASLLGDPSLRRLLDDGPSVGVHAIVLGSRPSQLPDSTGAMAVLGGEVNTRLRLEQPDAPPLDGVVADLASADWAERLARALAPLRESDGFSAPRLPEQARLLSLLGLDLLTPAKLAARWSQRPADAEVVMGADDAGAVRTDLTGHHILAAGVPGSGVSETLRALACCLAAVNRPEYLRIALVSGGRGPSLEQLRALPHADVHLGGDVAPEALRKLLGQVEQEVDRRLKVVKQGVGGVGDGLDDVLGLRINEADPGWFPAEPDPQNPRMLIVIDGFDRLAVQHPWFAKGMAACARDGRRLGLHVMVGVTLDGTNAIRRLEEDLCEEAHIRFALRTHTPDESRKVASMPEAAGMRADTPGRAHVAMPDGRVLAVQIGQISGRMPSSASARAAVLPMPWTGLGSPLARRTRDAAGTSGGSNAGTSGAGGPTDLALFIETVQRAATRG
jgi:pSer/pThr/pTyr-binding forkhead associated (FHA) protein